MVGEEYNVCVQENLVENGYLEQFEDSDGNAITLSEGSEDDCGM